MSIVSEAAEVARLRRALGDRLDAYAARQANLQRLLDAIETTAREGTGSVAGDLGEIIGRIGDLRVLMPPQDFDASSQVLAMIEAALKVIRGRA